MRTSQNTQNQPLLTVDELAKTFIGNRSPEPDLRCLEAMYQEFTCSESHYSQEDRSNAWLLYQGLRDLLECMKGGDNE